MNYYINDGHGMIGSLNYHLRNGVNRAPWYLCGPNWDIANYGNYGGLFFGEIDPLDDYIWYGSLTSIIMTSAMVPMRL